MRVSVTGAAGQLGASCAGCWGRRPCPSTSTRSTWTTPPRWPQESRTGPRRGHQLCGLHPGGSCRERAERVPDGQRHGGEVPGRGLLPARLPVGADQHRLRVQRPARPRSAVSRGRADLGRGRVRRDQARRRADGGRRYPKHLIVRTCGLVRPAVAHAGRGTSSPRSCGWPARGRSSAWSTISTARPATCRTLPGRSLFLLGAAGGAAGPLGHLSRDQRRRDQLVRVRRRDRAAGGAGRPVWSRSRRPNTVPPRRGRAYSVLDTSAYHRLGGPAMPDWQQGVWRSISRN